jgi:FHS family L-fucose permease-like MFS transporter
MAKDGIAGSVNLRVPLAYAISTFFIWGLAYGLLDVLNKHFQEVLHVGKAQSTWLQIAYFGAYLTMSLPAGAWLNRRGYRSGILTGLLIAAAGAFLFVPAARAVSFPWFVGAMFVLATGLCFLETAADTYVNVLGPPEGASQRLNLAQSFNSVGVFIGPIIGGAAFFGAANAGSELNSVQVIYGIIGVAILLYAAVVARAPLPEIKAEAVHDAGGESLMRHPHFVAGVITLTLYIGAQVGCGAFFINAAVETWPGLESKDGAYMLSLAMLGYLIGRFGSTALMTRIAPRTILIVYGIANTALCCTVALGIPKVSSIALVPLFFFMSAMFATVFTLGIRGLGGATKRASSLMVMSIGAGGVLLPYPMGLVAEAFGTPVAFLMPAACFLLVAWYGWKGAVLPARSAS